jgi:DNA-directed RNA polymerase subunit A'
MKRAEKKVDGFAKDLQDKTLERLPGQSLVESFELYVMNELAEARKKAGETAESDLEIENSGIIMTRSGARGSTLNIGQMTACLGQQSVRGKRIIRGYLDRALPHFKKGDPSAKARGFVYSSYRDGLDPIEFFFHAMGGREGLVDTAVRTQQSGYMQRRLINALEHLRVEYDSTVRNSMGEIIQFKYGEDGVDPAKSDHGKAVNVKRLIAQINLMAKKEPAASIKYVEDSLKTVENLITPLLVKELKNNLLKSKLGKKSVEMAIKLTLENYKRSLVEPGEASGIIAAQSIGEPGTQMTLRTFHYAGVREQNVTLGLPRLIEIVDARREPSTPIMTIYLEKKNRKKRERATEVARKILHTQLSDIAEIIRLEREDVVYVKLALSKMEKLKIDIKEVQRMLDITNCSITFNENTITFEMKKGIRRRDQNKLLKRISSQRVKGAIGIRRVLITEENNEWVIRTDGSNLDEVLEIEGVDPNRTITNNVHEISKSLGIEAARNSLIMEATNVLEEQGLDVDSRHIMLVADIMTSTGKVRQIGRHGVSGGKASVLARAAFEITLPNIVAAAIKGESDPLKGVTENVIVGQSIPIGTGLVELYMSAPQKVTKGEKTNG